MKSCSGNRRRQLSGRHDEGRGSGHEDRDRWDRSEHPWTEEPLHLKKDQEPLPLSVKSMRRQYCFLVHALGPKEGPAQECADASRSRDTSISLFHHFVAVQSSGIRQGCPLSPFLFVLVMSVIDHNISRNFTARTRNARFEGLDFDRVYYAITCCTNREGISSIWAKMNRENCSDIALNGNSIIKFADGTRLTRVNEANYLGREITQAMGIRHEINHKMHQTLKLWFELNAFWKSVNCPKHWKLHVCDAIIKNKLLYWLETVHLTQAMQKKVNAFQLRGVRKILGIDTTYAKEANTNARVIERAIAEIAGKKCKTAFRDVDGKMREAGWTYYACAPARPFTPSKLPARFGTDVPHWQKEGRGPRQNWLVYTNKFIWESYMARPFAPYANTNRQNQ